MPIRDICCSNYKLKCSACKENILPGENITYVYSNNTMKLRSNMFNGPNNWVHFDCVPCYYDSKKNEKIYETGIIKRLKKMYNRDMYNIPWLGISFKEWCKVSNFKLYYSI